MIDRLEQASLLAGLAGYVKRPDEDFWTFWDRIPVSSAEDHRLRETNSDDQIDSRIFLSSGGSTGAPKCTLLGFSEVLKNSAAHGQGYQACGILPSDVVATWGVPGVMSSEFTVYLALAETGCCILPIGDMRDPVAIIELVKEFRATVLLVMPSDLSPVVALLEESNECLNGIRLIITGGEALHHADKQRYRPYFGPDAKFRSVFQTSDTGTIGFQCQFCEAGEYHIHSDLQIIEIVGADASGCGELVTTNLQRRLVPVLRQRTGDLARFLTTPCPCGRESPRIQLLGRVGRYVKFGGEKIDVNELTGLREKVDLCTNDFQMILERDERGRDHFVLRSNRVFQDQALRMMLARLFSNLSPKIAAQLERRVVGPLEFAPMHETNLLLTPTGKTILFSDARCAGATPTRPDFVIAVP